MRYFITLSYDGAGFCGWQYQPNAVTVQECLEQTLSTLLKEPVQVVGAGRTDSKVNAIGYVAHFDYDKVIDTTRFGYKLNAILPRGIVVHSVHPADGDLHARFSATRREYTYFLHRTKDPFIEARSYFCPWALDVEAMNEAAALLLGTHDFRCFEKSGSDNHTSVCTVTEAFWAPYVPDHVALLGFSPAASPRSSSVGIPVGTLGSSPDSSLCSDAGSKGSTSADAPLGPDGLSSARASVFATGVSATSPDSGSFAVAGPTPDTPAVIPGTPPVIPSGAKESFAAYAAAPCASGTPPDSPAASSAAPGGPSPAEPLYLYFRIAADRFLRNMVRAVVGSLIEVGRGRRSIADFASLILPTDSSISTSQSTPLPATSRDRSTLITPIAGACQEARLDASLGDGRDERRDDGRDNGQDDGRDNGQDTSQNAGPGMGTPERQRTAPDSPERIRTSPDGTPFRSLAGESVPGHALFLSRVDY